VGRRLRCALSILIVYYNRDQYAIAEKGIMPAYIHISDVRCYKSCRQLWDFTSPLRLNLQPNWPNKHLWGGTALHIALAKYYDPLHPFDSGAAQHAFDDWLIRSWNELEQHEMPDDMWEEIFGTAALINGMLHHYLQWAPAHDKFKPLGTEVPFKFPIPYFPNEQVYYVGKADGFVRLHDGTYWLLEHKTASSYPDFSSLFLDEQCVAYQWASSIDERFEGVRPIGTMYTFALKQLPSIPRVLKNGGLSKAKDIRTTYEVYKDTLAKNDLPEELYADILEQLKEQGNTFFKRVDIQRQPNAVAIFGTRLMGTIAEMLDPQIHIAPSPNWWSCRNCSFRTPCTLAANGVDPTPVLHANYKAREGISEQEANDE
jgi:hypothetical protein